MKSGKYWMQIRQLELPRIKDFPIEEFFRIGFTHHIAILSQVKTVEERFFYIKLGAKEYLKVDVLKKIGGPLSQPRKLY